MPSLVHYHDITALPILNISPIINFTTPSYTPVFTRFGFVWSAMSRSVSVLNLILMRFIFVLI